MLMIEGSCSHPSGHITLFQKARSRRVPSVSVDVYPARAAFGWQPHQQKQSPAAHRTFCTGSKGCPDTTRCHRPFGWSQSPSAAPLHKQCTVKITGSLQVSANDVATKGTGHVSEVRPDFVSGQLLSKVSTWGIGGPAKYFIEIPSASEMTRVLRYCHSQKIRTFILGKGSNVLFDDRGFNGCVILNRIDFIEPSDDGTIRVGAGAAFNTLGIQTARLGFTGLEFASGIPGTVGGGVFMNAGAHGSETGDVVESVEIVMVEGSAKTLSRSRGELAWAYRTSPFQQMEGLAAIVAATFKLEKSGGARQRQIEYMDRRRQTQPITSKTAGCVFRNPGNDVRSAGALLDDLGLKGYSIGGAQVSEKHANFLINTGSATCEDVRRLIGEVKRRVKEQLQVDLHEEIKYVPYED